MNFYLDTNICVFFLRDVNASVTKKILNSKPDDIKIPSMVKAELLAGAFKSSQPEKI